MNKESKKLDYEKLARGIKRKVVGLIPARGGSKGIKDKNIINLDGYPLVAHAILSLKAAGIDDVYVSTDSKKIAAVSEKYGAKIIERPEYLSTDISKTEEAINHLL